MGETEYPIDLTEIEREKLEAIVSYGRHSAQKITRARILLKADDGESDSAIAEALDCSRSTAWRTRKKFHERDRIEAIKRKNSDRDYETKLDGRDEAYLIRLACSEPPKGRADWSLRVLAEKFENLDETDIESVSHETVRQTLKKTNSNPIDPSSG